MGVVVKNSVNAWTPSAIAAPKPARLRVIEMRLEKLCRGLRAFEIAWLIESLAGLRQSRDHQAIPCCNDFIVERRPRAVRTRFEQNTACRSQLLRGLFNG